MRVQWEQFGRGFEAFSVWISDKEKQLDPLKSSSAPLEQQISTVKVPGLYLRAGSQALDPHLPYPTEMYSRMLCFDQNVGSMITHLYIINLYVNNTGGTGF